jgi:hypothetical protein
MSLAHGPFIPRNKHMDLWRIWLNAGLTSRVVHDGVFGDELGHCSTGSRTSVLIEYDLVFPMLLNAWHGMNPDMCPVAAFESGHPVFEKNRRLVIRSVSHFFSTPCGNCSIYRK